MKRKNKKKNRFILVILLVVIVFTLFYFFINDNSKFALGSLKDFTASILNITIKDNYYNKDLVEEINNDYKKEIDNLKNTLNLNNLNSDKKIINATVIKRSSDYWYNLVTINKGRKDGIKKDLAVINNNGLVGKVIKVNNNTSDIKLLISTNDKNYISARFDYENNSYYGLINHYDYRSNELILSNVVGDLDKEKIINSNVVTSGLSDSFSSGLLIGKIKEVKKDKFGLSYTLVVTPSVNFNDINIVSIIVGDK